MKRKHSSSATRHTFATRLANWTIRRRWFVLAASLLIAAFFAMGGRNLGFNSDYRVFFSEANPQLKAFDALQDKFTKDDNILVVVEPVDGQVFSRETLAAVEELTEESWQTPYSSRVDAITNYQHTRAVEDDLYVQDLVEEATELSDTRLEEIRDIALHEPLLKNRLVNEDGTITAVNITLKLPGTDQSEQDSALAFVKQMADQFEQDHPGHETYISGVVPLTGAFKEAAQNDMTTLMPLMMLVIILTIGFATRSWTSTATAVLVIMLSVIAGLGFAGWIGLELTAPSSAAMTIIMTLAIADSIHILITIIQQMRAGRSKYAAIVESLRVNFMPVFITSLTTVIGFLTMNFSDAPPFRDLGNITAVGMMGALIFSTTTLPALVAILPMRVRQSTQQDQIRTTILARYADWVVGNHKALIWISSAVVLVVSVLSVRNELNDEFVNYFSNKIQFRSDTDYISDRLTGIYNTEFSLGSGEPGGINNPEYLQHLEQFEDWLYTQPEVIHVSSFSEVSKRINKSMHGDDESFYRVPDNREEAAQYLLLYEMSLPFGLDLNNQLNVDKSESRLTVTLENLSSNDVIAFNERAEDWLQENTPAYMSARATSTATMFAHLGGRQMRSMIKGTSLAILLITLILFIAMRSWKNGVLSLVPNTAPILVGFGIWAITSGMINTGISIVFGMTLGIIVDDTVHFISKYLRARREGGRSPEEAVRYAFTTVGRALVVTTVVLVAGFFILNLSQFALNNGMARLTMIIMTLALVIDFTLLPGLLIVFDKAKRQKDQKHAIKVLPASKQSRA